MDGLSMTLARLTTLLVLIAAMGQATLLHAQQPEPPSRISVWLPYQAVPSMMVISNPGDIPFAF